MPQSGQKLTDAFFVTSPRNDNSNLYIYGGSKAPSSHKAVCCFLFARSL